nr:MAG TPA: major capsid protein [Caudoviricetes sp.]
MKFSSIAEAFNYWNGKDAAAIERRAQELKATIQTDPDVDIKSANIELTALNQAKDNADDKAAQANTPAPADPEARGLKPYGMGIETIDPETVHDSKEYRTAFFKQLQGKELNTVERRALDNAARVERRADAYATSGNNAAIIPTQTLNEVIRKAGKANGLFDEVRKFQVPANVAVPVATPATAAKWNTEGATVDSESTDTTTVTFAANELIKVFSISAKVKTMAVDAFEAYLTDELNASVVEAIADAIVNGTGKGQPLGILNGVTWGASNKVTTTSLTYADIVKAMGLLAGGYQANAVFALSTSTLYNSVYGLTDGNKRPIFVQDAQRDNVGYILGRRVVVDDHIANGTILYGDFKDYYGVNLANGIAVESSTESSFKSGRVDYRALALADSKPLATEAFTQIAINAGA